MGICVTIWLILISVKDYFIGMYVYSTAATMSLEQFSTIGIRTINSGSFLLDKNYKDSFIDLFSKLTLELKRRTINTRLEKIDKDFDS